MKYFCVADTKGGEDTFIRIILAQVPLKKTFILNWEIEQWESKDYFFTVDVFEKLLFCHVCELVDALGEGLEPLAEPLVVGLDSGQVAWEHGSTVGHLGSGPVNK